MRNDRRLAIGGSGRIPQQGYGGVAAHPLLECRAILRHIVAK
ncbi:hypothetical protein EBBID32_46680 [Sphingobium indicum BiD32]|uniref:Uncharacterized protein n=1 Tax=Sphingobium indicum BiD32 TaxID=1301087 RepID=N1MU62_9SPHN|nr:hypothetical protein EBBID32_46680 [Sphingobium indicum BiD32]